MIKNRTAQIVFLTMACTVGLFGTVASVGFFAYTFSWDFYIHFTNISNYFCLAVMFAELLQTLKKTEDSYVSACPLLKFTGLLAIMITFLVFNVALAPARDMRLNFTVNSVCFHILMPALYVADWFLFYERKKVKWTYPLYSALFPAAYIVYLYIHGVILNFDSSIKIAGGTTPLVYPYFFLDLEVQGVDGVARWVSMLLGGFLAIGYLFYALDKSGKTENKKASPDV